MDIGRAKNFLQTLEAVGQVAALGLGRREFAGLLVGRPGLLGAPARRSRSARVAGSRWYPSRRPDAVISSTMASPAAMRSAIATATARLRSTIGDGATRANSV